jgi:hypothetical protein
MHGLRLIGAAALVGAGFGANAAAAPTAKLFGSGDVVPDEAYLIGYWGIGSAEECADSDTMSFYTSGAWAVTNGGGNPVEAIGVWSLADGAISVVSHDLKSPSGTEAITAVITEASQDKFTLTLDSEGSETLFRCQ